MLKACRLILLITLGATAQDQEAGPVPTWPRDGRVRPDDSRQYVFLTGDRHTMVVIVPKSSESERSGPEQIVKVPLMNDLAPAVSVSILTDVSGGLIYRYTVSNGRTATDAIGEWNIIGPPQDADLVVSSPVIGGEPVWAGAPAFAAIARQPILPQGPLGRYIGWFHQDDHVILPGQKTTGFVLRSRYRPGLTAAWFSSGKLLELDQSWPEEVFRQLEPVVNDRLWTQRFVITIGRCSHQALLQER